ncbi:N-acetyltransferase [Aquimarina hainanensis]|uniref:N-acetyltransferase n=1 Tax=Aquimarina hainanensis TaxID=1578017 RepID=A0ABW5NC16_9FLAO|nr:N-acetyltransferase [Aquimarina sp. TRL1]
MKAIPLIKLFGAAHCHKTHYYKLILEELKLPYLFLDVEEDEHAAKELRLLYENKKLNYPTITIGSKKLRNPYKDELIKWIYKLIPQLIPIQHDQENEEFLLPINEEIARITYYTKENKLYLTHSEVPYNLRGRGIGSVLVEKTLKKIEEEGLCAIAVCPFIKKIQRVVMNK